MTCVGEGDGLGSFSHAIAGQNFDAFRACQRVRIKAKAASKFHVHLEELWRRHRGGGETDVEVLRQSGVSVFEAEMDGRQVGSGGVEGLDRRSIR
jgi:hypothetical protein